MPLRREIGEFQKCCDSIVELITRCPELLTQAERLDLESGVVRAMNTIVATEEARRHPPSPQA
jgi:hypothetical protein